MTEANGDGTAGLQDLATFIVQRLGAAEFTDYLASAIARRLADDKLKPLIQRVALEVELERERIRKVGLAQATIQHLQQKGVTLDIVKGQLHASPRRLVDESTRKLIWALKDQLIQEITK